jgi:hypothetical protein
MQYNQQELVKVLDRAADFAKEFAPLLGALPALDELAEVRQALLSTGSDQYGAGKASVAGTVRKGDLRDRLCAGHMVPIARVAFTRREEIPLLKMEKFGVPPRAASDVTLLEAAGAMAKVSEEYYALLRPDLGDGFLDALREATKAFHESIITRDQYRFHRSRATMTIDLRERKARKVLAVLTSGVEMRLAARPELVAEFKRRVRIPKKPGLPQGSPKPGTGEADTGQAEGGALRIA